MEKLARCLSDGIRIVDVDLIPVHCAARLRSRPQSALSDVARVFIDGTEVLPGLVA